MATPDDALRALMGTVLKLGSKHRDALMRQLRIAQHGCRARLLHEEAVYTLIRLFNDLSQWAVSVFGPDVVLVQVEMTSPQKHRLDSTRMVVNWWDRSRQPALDVERFHSTNEADFITIEALVYSARPVEFELPTFRGVQLSRYVEASSRFEVGFVVPLGDLRQKGSINGP